MNASANGIGAPVRVMIVEDMGMFRAFLEEWIARLPQFALVAVAVSGEDGLAMVQSARPDVWIVDLQLPGMDGLEFIRAARQSRPHVRSLVLSTLDDPLALTRVRERGVEGYIEKNASPAQLTEALEAVASGQRFFSPRYKEVLSREDARSEALGKILSRREQEVLVHVLAGKSSREIGELIGFSPRTADFHRANIHAKLGATNVAELLTNARRRGLA